MKETQEASSIRYSLRIRDPATNKKCDVYISSDWDLESLLLFLRSAGVLEYDVSSLKRGALDPGEAI